MMEQFEKTVQNEKQEKILMEKEPNRILKRHIDVIASPSQTKGKH